MAAIFGRGKAGPKKKKLIVFCDGTWNKPDQRDDDHRPCPTNVAKLFEATASHDHTGAPQLATYVQGVGTHWYDRLLGGAFGFGISENIKEGYRFLCSNYVPGDEIYLFGFSRGAYAARSLAGLIHNLGILKRPHFDRIDEAYDHYRDKSPEWHPHHDPATNRGSKTREFRELYTHGGESIHFIGVWDTVGALGAPYGLILGWLVEKLFSSRFHSTQLSSSVKSGAHALALDERRWPFRPTLWTLGQTHDPQLFEQVWMPGVHSDVGGGYQDTGLSDLALEWMATQAMRRGLNIDLRAISLASLQQRPWQDRPIHHSQALYYQGSAALLVKWPALVFIETPGRLFRAWPRWVYGQLNRLGIIAEPDIGAKVARLQLNGDYYRPADAPGTSVSPWVQQKIAGDANYRPPNLPES